jgi:hypothetical protein
MRIILTIAFLTALAQPALGQPAASGGEVTPPRPYQSEMRGISEAELEKDAGWRAELENQLRPAVHADDAAIMLKNKRHVVMAYAALWVLTAAFLVLLWLRQRRLVGEIDRLAEQVKKAAES